MNDELENLPVDLKRQLLSFLKNKGDSFEVADMMGIVLFIVQHGPTYPGLYKLISLNEEAVIEHYKITGEVPPGVKLIHTTQESDKVTRLEVKHGPVNSKK